MTRQIQIDGKTEDISTSANGIYCKLWYPKMAPSFSVWNKRCSLFGQLKTEENYDSLYFRPQECLNVEIK